ncbi:hypothetical protein [Christiangramia sp. SM2212]|uniref:Transcriptional regulator n=1 Tax=Christiangramia sediminicola TaxID=3073267 RepID=A0ABU1EQ13_9FLAO|nr:hypothetical protein [Christiangramia sp. SM2212]MDR5590479.1 hypothetical protein [Christiangramia sp. SM2212]
MNIIKNHLNGNFTIIPNSLIEDNTLSDRSRFLYIFLVHKPKDWTFRTKHLSKCLRMHPDTFRKYRDELCSKRWIKVENQKYINGRFTEKIYHLFPIPYELQSEELTNNLDSGSRRNIPSQKNSATEERSDSKSQTPTNTNSQQKTEFKNSSNSSSKDTKISNYPNPNPRK